MNAKTAITGKRTAWIPLASNQIRLRHLCQISARSISPPTSTLENVSETYSYYFTLHITLMSAPFYTSELLSGDNVDWGCFDSRRFPENIVTTCSGVVVRLWARTTDAESQPLLVTVWGVHFSGLVYVGSQLPKDATTFTPNTLIFGMTWGYFVAPSSSSPHPGNMLETFVTQGLSCSYKVEFLLRIHRLQRAIYKQNTECERLRQEIKLVQSQPLRGKHNSFLSVGSSVVPTIDRKKIQELRTKRQLALSRVALLQEEKTKTNRHVNKLQEKLKQIRIESHTTALHLKEKHIHFRTQEDRLNAEVRSSSSVKEILRNMQLLLHYRRRQLISDLIDIFPITEGRNGLYSINGVTLPNSEDFMGFDENLLSVALGHVAHLVHMIAAFLQIPNRYPVRARSSTSTVVDEVNQQIPDHEREFPLYSRGKEKLFFQYAVYLLNKDIAQLRWYCGLATQGLAATLPNLSSLLQRLVTSSGDFSSGPKIVRAFNLSTSYENSSAATSPTFSSEADHFKWHFHPMSRSAGSELSLSSMLDPRGGSSPSLASQDLTNVADSPQIDAYFCRPPVHCPSETASLDLAAAAAAAGDGEAVTQQQECRLTHKSGSAPNLLSPELLHGNDRQESELVTPAAAEKTEEIPAVIEVDDVLCSVTARTEALASTSSSFKLVRRGRNPSQNNS